MKQFITFVQKEFYHIFRDRWTTIILLLLPVVMIFLFGFGISTEIKNSKFAVFAPNKSPEVQDIVNKLNNSEYFTLYDYVNDNSQIENYFSESKIGLVVVFSPDFDASSIANGEASIQLVADGSDPNTASTIVGYATNIIKTYQGLNPLMSAPIKIIPQIKLLYNPTMKGVYNTVPGIMGMILMLVCAMMTSVSIAREKELGTMEVLLVSPMKPLLLILTKVIPYFAIGLINLFTIIFLARFVLGVPVVGSLLLLVFVSMLLIFVSLALGLLISSVADTQMKAMLMSVMGLIVPVILLSGMLFPVESMPKPLQILANLVPAKWYIAAARNIMIKGVGITVIWKNIAVLSFMAVFFIGVSLKRFKHRLE